MNDDHRQTAIKLQTLADACSDALLGGECGWERMEFDEFVSLCRKAIGERNRFKQQILTLEATIAQEREMYISTASTVLNTLMIARISSCTCLTKTPDPSYHAENCRYRIFADTSDLVQKNLDTIRNKDGQV